MKCTATDGSQSITEFYKMTYMAIGEPDTVTTDYIYLHREQIEGMGSRLFKRQQGIRDSPLEKGEKKKNNIVSKNVNPFVYPV